MPIAIVSIFMGAVAAKADCQADFQAVMAAHLKAGPYRVISKGGVWPYELDVAAPDSFHMREQRGGTSETLNEVVFTPKGGWAKEGKGKWDAIPKEFVTQAVTGLNGGLAGGFKGAKEIECKTGEAPQAMPNGKKATGYYVFKAGVFDMHEGRDVPTSAGLFIGEDGKPAALILHTAKGDEVQEIAYDAKIKVSAPE